MIMQRSAPRERTLAGAERAERRLRAEVVLPGADHEPELGVDVGSLVLLGGGLSHFEVVAERKEEDCVAATEVRGGARRRA